jgi:ADP-ribose pyrophosphatase YjhB (NUDIX family)
MEGAMGTTYKKPSLTVDCVVFGLDEEDLKIILIERGLEPFKGRWALPGGFVNIDEALEAAAMRELQEETGVRNVFLEQLYTFGDVDRDPRDRVVSVAYYALVNLSGHKIKAATDARNAAWFPVDDIPKLAFDHNRIFDVALKRLRGKVRYEPIGFELLPEKFTLGQLQKMYEKILEQDIDKRNFRKKILGMELLRELDEVQMDVAHRAAKLYQFDERKYRQLKEKGFNFEI